MQISSTASSWNSIRFYYKNFLKSSIFFCIFLNKRYPTEFLYNIHFKITRVFEKKTTCKLLLWYESRVYIKKWTLWTWSQKNEHCKSLRLARFSYALVLFDAFFELFLNYFINKSAIKKRLLVSRQSPDCSDCLLKIMEQ